jgi:hypothetical protein
LAILSLDFPSALVGAESATGIAFDNHGRIVVAGNLDGEILGEGPIADWTIARVLTNDVIFRDGLGDVLP